MKKKKSENFKKGFAVYFAVLIMSLMMSVLLVLVYLSMSQIKIIWSLGNSDISFYAADTGIERMLYNLYKGSYLPVLGDCPYSETLSNGAFYQVCVSDTSTSTIRSSGSYRSSSRKIEINLQ